jgi:tRNA1Val (adenine37-N6)-methyltransferase
MSEFQFKKFSISQSRSALKVGTDAMVLGALIDGFGKKRALDIGTGTGVLAMMAAQKNIDLNTTAIEIDVASFEDAKFNFENGPFANRLFLRNEDFLKSVFEEQFDLIFTNPPFYTDALKANNERTNLAKHSSELNAETLFRKASTLLSDSGDFWLIWQFKDKDLIVELAQSNKLFLKQNITIEGSPKNPIRSVLCFSKMKTDFPVQRSLVIRNESGTYSNEYKNLTKEFHGRTL